MAYNEIRGDQELAKKDGNKEAIAKWTPDEKDKRLIANLIKEYPALDWNMAETMYMFCKHSPEDAEKMVDGTYEYKYHKDEYYQDIPDGAVFHDVEIDRSGETYEAMKQIYAQNGIETTGETINLNLGELIDAVGEKNSVKYKI